LHHEEQHRTERIGWLRAADLGANDGIVSTGSLIMSVAAAEAARANIIVAGVAGLAAGRCRWRPANTCRSVPKPTLKKQTSNGNDENWRQTQMPNIRTKTQVVMLLSLLKNLAS
jgi:hypothetical protein